MGYMKAPPKKKAITRRTYAGKGRLAPPPVEKVSPPAPSVSPPAPPMMKPGIEGREIPPPSPPSPPSPPPTHHR